MDVNNLTREEINSVRSWFVDRMDCAYIVADSSFCYMDANESAKKIFPKLRELMTGDMIPSEMKSLFTEDEERVRIGERYFKKNRFERWGNENYNSVSLYDRTEEAQLTKDLAQAKTEAETTSITKSIFLSNVSHEIRTPMNAIVGLSDLLLRENVSPHVREYLNNIKGSAGTLLSIINDILDISKIEDGSLKINEEEYEPMSFLTDLSMIFLNKLEDKPVELLYDIDPELPSKLLGDSRRIQQIIINMVNNAIEYTSSGFIRLSISVTDREDDFCQLTIAVTDSGQGIREEDKGDLFYPFQKIDEKKRNEKEGLGFGLTICRQLVKLMGGTIGVDSTFGSGSRFFFTLPQGIVHQNSAAELIDPDRERKVYYSFDNRYLEGNLIKLCDEYGVRKEEFSGAVPSGEGSFLFTDDPDRLGEELIEKLGETGTRVYLLYNPMRESFNRKGLREVNKPLYTLNFCQIMNDNTTAERSGEPDIDFTAPEARILIVDDNEMNLQVAIGLLEPLNMQIDTAENGKAGLECVLGKKYDLIFMDHMMPVMDGVEATDRIRKIQDGIYEDLPIIALSANATAEAEAMFRESGFTDFIEKPIKIREIYKAVRTYLPESKKQIGPPPPKSEEEIKKEAEVEVPAEIEGLDVDAGIQLCGSPALFLKCLVIFYKIIDKNSTKIQKFLDDGLIRDYTIEVHALKNSARMIGARELSEDFKELEQMGNDDDIEGLTAKTPGVLELYRSYKAILKPFAESDKENSYIPTKEEVIDKLQQIKDAMDAFDMDGADEAMGKLREYALPGGLGDKILELDALVSDFAMEDVIELSEELINGCEAYFGKEN